MALSHLSNSILGTYGILGLQDLNVLRPHHPSISTHSSKSSSNCSTALSTPSSQTQIQTQSALYRRKSIPLLPQEIQDIIIDYLHDDPSSLRTCLFVCKSWGPTVRYHLYDSFRIHYYDVTDQDVDDALQTLQRIQLWRKNANQKAHSSHAGLPSTSSSSASQILPPPPTVTPITPHARIPRRLSVVGDRCTPVSEEWLLPLALRLHHFTSVTSLELDDIEWEDVLASKAWAVFTGKILRDCRYSTSFYRGGSSRHSGSQPQPIASIVPGTGGRAFCEQITSLFLGSVDMRPFHLLRDVITAFPSLEKLELFPTYVADDVDSDSVEGLGSEDENEDEDEIDGDVSLDHQMDVDMDVEDVGRGHNGAKRQSQNSWRPSLHLPPPSLNTLIAEASPGAFILRPFFRWLISSSFAGLKVVRLGVIGRRDIKDFVQYLGLVGPGLQELAVGFELEEEEGGSERSDDDSDGLRDLELFISYGGLSKNTGLVTLEVVGLFEANTSTTDVDSERRQFPCYPTEHAPTFLHTIRSPALETLVFSINDSSADASSSSESTPLSTSPMGTPAPTTSIVLPSQSSRPGNSTSKPLRLGERWEHVNSILADRRAFPVLENVKFLGPHPELESFAFSGLPGLGLGAASVPASVSLPDFASIPGGGSMIGVASTSMPIPIPVDGFEGSVAVPVPCPGPCNVFGFSLRPPSQEDEQMQVNARKAFDEEMSGTIRRNLPGFAGSKVVVYQVVQG